MSTPPDITEKAEEVRAYLVAARGGAPFLSAADGRLLVRWLEGGISVAKILAAVDEVAIKRRKKRARGRLSLSSCRRIIEGKKNSISLDQPVKRGGTGNSEHPLEAYAQALSHMPVPEQLTGEREKLAKRIRSAMQSENDEQTGLDAIASIRIFHETVWNFCSENHSNLRAEARLELSALKEVLSTEAFESAVEEVARDIVRRKYPLVSATAVWDRLSGK